MTSYAQIHLDPASFDLLERQLVVEQLGVLQFSQFWQFFVR